ncbi:MAG: TIGR04076 family protein [Theionarchaea archaeon]|nr:TIGR04076 family protein [Theionarchaea archaeon]
MIDEEIWNVFQKHVGYTDEEMDIFRKNPRNADVLSKGSALLNKTIVVEVVESHGCNSRHTVGDKFYFDGAGNLLTKLCPKKVCIYALQSVTMLIFASNELFYAGADPNDMRFKRAGCFDVGVHCGGWGHIVMEIRVEERKR